MRRPRRSTSWLRSRRIPAVALGALALIAIAAPGIDWDPPAEAKPKPPARGCFKDTDCRSPRVCAHGQCEEPPIRVPITYAPPVVRPDGGIENPVVPTVKLAAASAMFHADWSHTGRSRFRVPLTAPRTHLRLETGGVVVSSPAIASGEGGGIAYFGSHDRKVRAATPDGKLRWTHATSDLVWCSPALGPGPGGAETLYVGADDDKLHALDPETGAPRWLFAAGPCRSSTGVGPEASRCDVDAVTIGPDGTIFAVADGIYGLSPEGTLKFSYRLPTHCATAPAVGPDGTVYAGCQDGTLYALGPDGAPRWQFRARDDIDSAPAVAADGTIYFGADDHRLYAVTPAGALKWAVQTGGDVRSSPAIGESGVIYVGSFDGGLYAVRPDGAVAWVFHAADRILSSPAIDAAGTILFGAQDDRLYALSPDGKQLWSVLLDGDVDGTPAIGPDGAIYVGADDKALHILR